MPVDNDWWPGFSDQEYEKRLDEVTDAMHARGLDALLVYGTSIYFGSDPGAPNLAYLAGYAPGLHGYVVLTPNLPPTLLVYVPNHKGNAELLGRIQDVRAGNDLAGMAVERLREDGRGFRTIGVVGNFDWSGSSIPIEHYRVFEEAFPEAEIEVVTRWYEELRLVKSTEEIALIEEGGRITDAAHQLLLESIEPGVTDIELHNVVLSSVHQAGARIPFGHVGSTPMDQPTMRYPSFYPVNRAIREGDVVLTEIAAGKHGYFGKIFGTIFVGEPNRVYREMFEIGAEIHGEIFAATKPGERVGSVDQVLDGRAPGAGYRSISYISGWSTYNTPPAHSRPSGADADMILREGHCLVVVAYVIDPRNDNRGIWLGSAGIVDEDGLRPLHGYPVTNLDRITVQV